MADAVVLFENLRQEDKSEMEGLGHFGPPVIPASIAISEVAVSLFSKEDQLAGCAGIVRQSDDVGLVWLLCTPEVQKYPVALVKHAKKWLAEQEQNYRILWNLADARNHLHHKFLKMLGFKALRTLNVGPNFLPYHEIVKLCAYH